MKKNSRYRKRSRPIRNLKYPINLFCEGLQEEKYFCKIRDLINSQPNRDYDIELNVFNVGGGDASAVIEKAKQITIGSQNATVVFDHDLKPNIFNNAIDEAKGLKFSIGYSILNFDLWILLHKENPLNFSLGPKTKNSAYVSKIRKLYGLSKQDDIKSENIIKKIIAQIGFDQVNNAIICTKRIHNFNSKNHGSRVQKTPKNNVYYINPDLTIDQCIEKIIKDTKKDV
ncbi:MAG: RloB family protein [Clostridia bacterium]|nr:RloB family protein [Clostridia bacterium]